jgi:hypothetical protein
MARSFLDHGLCSSWVLVPVLHRGLVFCKRGSAEFGVKKVAVSILLNPWRQVFTKCLST